MKFALRILLGIFGLLGLVVALRAWTAPEMLGAQFGLGALDGPLEGLGLASIRADIGGFFAAAGALTIAAALRDQARLMTAPLGLVGAALAARLVTAVVDGYSPAMAQPMAIEAVLLVVFGLGRLLLKSA